MNGISILGTGRYVPQNSMDNHQLSLLVDTNDEWITTRTGIKKRHISTDENTSEIAAKAAQKALKASGISPNKIGLILVATFTPDCYTPSVACMVQKHLGLTDVSMMAFDLNAACSGFVYALTVASSLLAAMPDKYALVIGAEVISKLVDYTDRSTCILFGDGAGAVVLAHSKLGSLYSYLDARGDDCILHAPCVNIQDREKPQLLKMNGKDVYQFAVDIIPRCITNVLQQAGCTLDDICYVVCHQANARIITSVAKKLSAKPGQFYINIEQYGNTSAASIPLALDEMNRNGLLKKGDKLILTGFGGGLTWGAVLLEW